MENGHVLFHETGQIPRGTTRMPDDGASLLIGIHVSFHGRNASG